VAISAIPSRLLKCRRERARSTARACRGIHRRASGAHADRGGGPVFILVPRPRTQLFMVACRSEAAAAEPSGRQPGAAQGARRDLVRRVEDSRWRPGRSSWQLLQAGSESASSLELTAAAVHAAWRNSTCGGSSARRSTAACSSASCGSAPSLRRDRALPKRPLAQPRGLRSGDRVFSIDDRPSELEALVETVPRHPTRPLAPRAAARGCACGSSFRRGGREPRRPFGRIGAGLRFPGYGANATTVVRPLDGLGSAARPGRFHFKAAHDRKIDHRRSVVRHISGRSTIADIAGSRRSSAGCVLSFLA